MTCETTRKFIDAYMDGELEAGSMIEVEGHLSGCTSCGALLQLKRAMKREVHEAGLRVRAPENLRSRVLKRSVYSRPRVILLAAVPLAAAAVLSFWLVGSWQSAERREQLVSQLVDDVVNRHDRALPMEVSGGDSDRAASWFQGKVDFPVRPLGPGLKQASFEGARVSNVQQQQAAHMTYLVDGHRVTLMIFPAEEMRISGGRVQIIKGIPVLTGTRRGYNVAMTEQNGMIYALSSDLSSSRLVQLLTSRSN